MKLVSFLNLAALASPILAGQAVWFNTQCGTISVDRIDPIISPKVASNHLHILFGAGNVGMDATYDTLTQSKCNTCGVKEDNSLYWIPTHYFWRKDGTYSPLAHTGSIPVYYKFMFDGNDIPKNFFEPFPEGFQQVVGDITLRSSNRTSDQAQKTLWYVCDADRSVYYPTYPVNRKCKTITVGINFPWCWNGQATSPDHKSHVVYPTNWETKGEMKCPSTHPRSLPVPFMEHDFDASAFQDMYDEAMYPSQPFVTSYGDPSGASTHADFQNGWDFDRLKFIMENYKAGDRPSDLGWLTNAHPDCPVRPASVKDNQGTPGQWLTELPGGLKASGHPQGVPQNPNAPPFGGSVGSPVTLIQTTPAATSTKTSKTKTKATQTKTSSAGSLPQCTDAGIDPQTFARFKRFERAERWARARRHLNKSH